MRRRDQPITIERVERALALVSWMIIEDGPAWTPYFERLERELTTMRARDDAMPDLTFVDFCRRVSVRAAAPASTNPMQIGVAHGRPQHH